MSDLLNSWKEISRYLRRGVRTVQRWEVELALPVRRPHGRSRSTVFAFKHEIDEWLRSAPVRSAHKADSQPRGEAEEKLRHRTAA